MRLHIIYDEEVNYTCYFTYYIGGIKIAENKDVVSSDLLMAKKDLIGGFVMLSESGSTTKKSIKKETPKKIEKIQKESKPEPEKDFNKL